MPKIVMDHICKMFDQTVAADDLCLEVEDGEYICILGPTGAGKTTLMRMICGLTEPDSGRVMFGDEDMTRVEVEKREATMLSQTYSLFPQLNVIDNVLFAPNLKGWNKDESMQLAKNVLNMVHMTSRAYAFPNELSGGQQQRIALARALVSDSKVLLLDEPLRALDARLRLELRKELKSLVKSMGLTAIHVTHDQDEALEMADRIAIIRHGKIIQVGTPREVFECPKTPFVANFVGRSNMISGTIASVANGVAKVTAEDGKTSFDVADCGFAPGKKVLVAIKVGSTKISAILEEGYFTGRIERVLYEGGTITIEVQVSGIGLISSKLPNRKYDDFINGNTVSVSWTPSKANVFEHPEEGLEYELRVD